MTAGSTSDWLRRVPKVELHLHLEGAIPHAALWQLVQKYGGDPALPDRQALVRKFAYRNSPHCIETWIWKNRFLREYEDFTLLAEAVARDLVRQNVRYVEAFYSPSDFRHQGLEPQPLTAAIRLGLDRVPELEVALVADLVRDSELPAAARTRARPPARRVYWGAIRSLKAERLGHAHPRRGGPRPSRLSGHAPDSPGAVPDFEPAHERGPVNRRTPGSALL